MNNRTKVNSSLPTVNVAVVRYVQILGKIQPGHPYVNKLLGTVSLERVLRDGWTIVNLHDSYIALVK